MNWMKKLIQIFFFFRLLLTKCKSCKKLLSIPKICRFLGTDFQTPPKNHPICKDCVCIDPSLNWTFILLMIHSRVLCVWNFQFPSSTVPGLLIFWSVVCPSLRKNCSRLGRGLASFENFTFLFQPVVRVVEYFRHIGIKKCI